MNKSRTNTQTRRPFWLPAFQYYLTSLAVAVILFLSTLLVLDEGTGEEPFLLAGSVGIAALLIAFVLREFIFHSFRMNSLAKQKMLDRSVLSAAKRGTAPNRTKVTLSENSRMLSELTMKSDAVKLLAPVADIHREVFELCQRYIDIANTELPYIGAGSPRLSAIVQGKGKAEKLHRFHMLKWAELEVKGFTSTAAESEGSRSRETKLAGAIEVVDKALEHYPEEPDLVSSRSLLAELMANLKAVSFIKKAQTALKKDDTQKALNAYRSALAKIEEASFDREETLDLRRFILEEIDSLELRTTVRTTEMEV